MDMNNLQYLSPSIAMVMPKLDEQLDHLTQEALKKGIASYIKKLCESDPELADIIMEEKKTLPRCIRYVLEKAQQYVVNNVEAMVEQEYKQLEDKQVRGVMATMAGAAIPDEQMYQWAKDYLYGGPSVEPSDAKKSGASKPAKNNKSAPKGGKGNGGAGGATKAENKKDSTGAAKDWGKSASGAVTGTAKNPDAMDGGTQIALAGFAAPQKEADSEKPAA